MQFSCLTFTSFPRNCLCVSKCGFPLFFSGQGLITCEEVSFLAQRAPASEVSVLRLRASSW